MPGTQCADCGLIHPYMPPGECPVAKGRKLKEESESVQNAKVITLLQAIQTRLIQKLKMLSQAESEDLAMRVYHEIDK